MKTVLGVQIFVAVLVCLGISFSSCEKAEELFDVEFDASFGGNLTVAIDDCNLNDGGRLNDLGCEFSETVLVKFRSDPDIDDYYDKLKGFKILNVTGEVKSVTGGPVVINGTLTIGAGSLSASWAIENFEITPGASITLDNAKGQWDTVNKILNAKKDFTISVVGKSDKKNVSFVLYVEVRVKVTANPL